MDSDLPDFAKDLSGSSFQLYLYIGREFFLSFLVSFAFFFFMFFINQLLLLAEDILQKDVSFLNVAQLIIFSLPAIIALSVPFATLVGSLMTVGRLSSENEIMAMQSLGFSTMRMFIPILVPAILLSALSFTVNDNLLPLGTLNFGRLYRELLYSNPSLELDPYSVKRFQDDVLVTGSLEPGRLDDFVIIDTDAQGYRRAIVADEALFTSEGDRNVISLDLRGVTSHTHVSDEEYHYSVAERLVYNILLQDITIAIRSPGPREMSARDVQAAIVEKESAFFPRLEEYRRQTAVLKAEEGLALLQSYMDPSTNAGRRVNDIHERFLAAAADKPEDRSLRIYRLEYHKKFSIPFSAISFVLLAFPLGLFTNRSGRTVGFGIGLLISTLYWALLIGGQTFGTQRSGVPPALAMWLPNILFGVAGIVAFMWRVRK